MVSVCGWVLVEVFSVSACVWPFVFRTCLTFVFKLFHACSEKKQVSVSVILGE